MPKASTWILVGSKSSYNTFEDTLVYFISKTTHSQCLRPVWFRPTMFFVWNFQLLHQVSKQGIVFIELCIVDMAIIQFFNQDFIIRFALQLNTY